MFVCFTEHLDTSIHCEFGVILTAAYDLLHVTIKPREIASEANDYIFWNHSLVISSDSDKLNIPFETCVHICGFNLSLV